MKYKTFKGEINLLRGLLDIESVPNKLIKKHCKILDKEFNSNNLIKHFVFLEEDEYIINDYILYPFTIKTLWLLVNNKLDERYS